MTAVPEAKREKSGVFDGEGSGFGPRISAHELAQQIDFFVDRPSEILTWSDLFSHVRAGAEYAVQMLRNVRAFVAPH
jgi:hypothetical protein